MVQTSSQIKSTASNEGRAMADKAADFAEKATDQIGRVIENVDATARNVAEQGRQAGEQVQEVAGNFKSAIEKSVKTQPMTTLALAVMAGFVVGALWKS